MSIVKSLCTLITAAATFSVVVPSAFAQKNHHNEKILIVVSSLDKKTPDQVGGFWFPELTHPIEVFDQAGLDYDIASPQGGLAPFDGFDLKDHASLAFWTSATHRNKLGHTIKLADVDASKYAAILLVGGHGPMWDFVSNPELITLIRTMYEHQAVVSAVCHGPAGLVNVKLSNGEPLLKGRRVTGFTAEEELARKYDKIVPFELEAALKTAGATFEEAPIFENKVVIDGRLITGQNPASAKAVGEAVAAALAAGR